MHDQIQVVGPRDRTPLRRGTTLITTVAKGGPWIHLSPFRIGPCVVPGHGKAQIMENAWQFAKVYPEHALKDGRPSLAYWEWATAGWADTRAHRYPMGKGRKPLYSLWRGKQLDYISARKHIYLPLYRDAVKVTQSYHDLYRLVVGGKKQIALWDYDGYDHEALDLSLWDVLNNPERKMGHAFVLKMMLMYGSDFRVSDVKRECAK